MVSPHSVAKGKLKLTARYMRLRDIYIKDFSRRVSCVDRYLSRLMSSIFQDTADHSQRPVDSLSV